MTSTGGFGKADSGFAVEDDMQVPDHAGCLQQGLSHVVIAAPSVFDGQGDGVDVDDTVATGTGGDSDLFAHVADCRYCPFKHAALLIVVEVLEPVGVADEFGNETVGQGHVMRLPGRPGGVNREPAAWASGYGFKVLA